MEDIAQHLILGGLLLLMVVISGWLTTDPD